MPLMVKPLINTRVRIYKNFIARLEQLERDLSLLSFIFNKDYPDDLKPSQLQSINFEHEKAKSALDRLKWRFIYLSTLVERLGGCDV